MFSLKCHFQMNREANHQIRSLQEKLSQAMDDYTMADEEVQRLTEDKRTLEDKLSSKEKTRDSQRVLRQDLVESEVGIVVYL